MRISWLAALNCCWAAAVLAEENGLPAGTATPAPVEAPVVRSIPQGYAVNNPELLADQRVWGIVHGARLLALSCADGGYGSAAEAWVSWREREAGEIAAMSERLGQHYFGRTDVTPDALVAALGLRQTLRLPPDTLAAACDSLTEALAQERYDLAKRRTTILKE